MTRYVQIHMIIGNTIRQDTCNMHIQNNHHIKLSHALKHESIQQPHNERVSIY